MSDKTFGAIIIICLTIIYVASKYFEALVKIK